MPGKNGSVLKTALLETVQNSTLQSRKEPENRDFFGLLTAKIHNFEQAIRNAFYVLADSGASEF
jgi:hypothetical protein